MSHLISETPCRPYHPPLLVEWEEMRCANSLKSKGHCEMHVRAPQVSFPNMRSPEGTSLLQRIPWSCKYCLKLRKQPPRSEVSQGLWLGDFS